MSEELRPCPFCGSTESDEVADNCYLQLTDWIGDKRPPQAEIEKRWNTRPIEDALTARIAELEGFIGQLIEAGDAMSNAHSMWVAEEDKWDALVKDWEEREE